MKETEINEGMEKIRRQLDDIRYRNVEACLASLRLYLLTDCRDRLFLHDAIRYLSEEEYNTRID